MYQDDKDWKISADSKAPFDPLLGCLTIITKHFDHPYSEQALTAGLPLVKNKLTPELFVRSASRAGLSAKLIQLSLLELTTNMLPAVLLLDDNKACVVIDIVDEKSFSIIQPESGDGTQSVLIDEFTKNYSGYLLCTKPSYKFDKRAEHDTPTDTKNWFWGAISKAWPIYSEVLGASFFINLFAIASPLFIMNVYDRVVPNKAIETLWVLAIGVTIAFGFDFLMRTIRSYFIDNAGKNIDIRLSRIIFERLLGVEMGSRPNSVGAMVHTVHAFEGFREFITSATISTLVDAPFIFVFLGVIALLAGNLVYVPLTLIPIILVVSLLIQIPLTKLIKESFQHSAEKQAVLIESLACTETIKGVRGEGPMQRRWEAITSKAAKTTIKTKLLGNIASNFTMFAQHMGSICVVIFGVYKISAGDITMGALIACTIMTGRTLAPVTQIARLFSSYQQAKAGLDSVNSVMQMPVERPAGKQFLHRPIVEGAVEFNNVSFTYPESPIPAIENISFKIKAGERVGIIGRTGSGKTTIEKLILKLYQSTEGSILIDGTELNQIDPADLRHYIGYVPQDVVLFHGSVKHNIVVGAPHSTDDDVLRAANLSGVSSFVNKHPEGFDRQVGERGELLSGGQRQSIALARALLLDPPILVFDEPSNSMDDSTTTAMMQRLSGFLPGKTLILITHKSSLLKMVNRLLVIDQGHLIADGPKEAVLKKLAGSNVRAKV